MSVVDLLHRSGDGGVCNIAEAERPLFIHFHPRQLVKLPAYRSRRAGAAWALSGVMDEGGKIGLLADQYYDNGPMVTFFGHKAAANPLLAKLARNYDCPVYPARTIRLPGGRYRIELQDRLELPRDKAGGIDTDATTQLVNTVMEGWIREHPEQWLWLHRRWRSSKPRRRKRSRRPVSNRPS